jgi:adenylosuccinate lyase
MHHDMNAFLRSVSDSLGEEGRWVHLGLTSYDTEDPATGIRLVEAGAIIAEDLRLLEAAITKRALEHKDTICMGRSHGMHAEPITFGLKLLNWLDEVRRNQVRLEAACKDVAVGKLSGPVGSHATVPPELEERVCSYLGLGVDAVSTQVVSRDRHAAGYRVIGFDFEISCAGDYSKLRTGIVINFSFDSCDYRAVIVNKYPAFAVKIITAYGDGFRSDQITQRIAKYACIK